MKVRLRDYFGLVYSILVKEPATRAAKLIRYKSELGGEDGFEVNGIADYWGRYATVDKIVELARTLEGSGDWFSFNYPARKYEGKYHHRIRVCASKLSGMVEIQFEEASDQSGAYLKVVAVDSLAEEIHRLGEIEDSLDAFGYKYRYDEDSS